MRFRLVYSGSLSASSNNSSKAAQVRDIRDKLHPQLAMLWETHTALKRLRYTSHIRRATSANATNFPPLELIVQPPPNWGQQVPQLFADLCEPIRVGARKVIPLVRRTLSLNCSLDILFLRKEDPGSLVFQGGDLDNRIKTLFDALRMPSEAEDNRNSSAHDPLYCLMESDTLVSQFDVGTDRLLSFQTDDANEVLLIIDVAINVLEVGDWNVCLVGN